MASDAARDRTAPAKIDRNLASAAVPIINPAAVPPIIRPVSATVIDARPIISRAVRVITVRIVTIWTVRITGRVSTKTDWESEPYAD